MLMLCFDKLYGGHSLARSLSYARNGLVGATQPLAAQAGLAMLKKGGNAVDAAIAVAACLSVVEPTSNGLGSDAFAIVWMKGKMFGLNSSGPAPEAISIDKVRGAGFEKMPLYGWTPVTVPGAPGAWASLSARFGRLGLEECLAPAVYYAREGYPVSPTVAYNWSRAFENFSEVGLGAEFKEWFRVFAPGGRAPKVGEMWASPDHAASLEEIGGTDAESFYRGRLAEDIAAASSQHGGYLNLSDLANFVPQWVEPISVNYRGYDVWEMPPNGQGLVALMALNILKGYDFPAMDCDTCHIQFEAIKLAFTAGKNYISDPAYMDLSYDELLSEDYAARQRSVIGESAAEPALIEPSRGGTVYLATADGEGNMVSYIQSNYMGFGSGVVVPGTGISLQNRGCDFSLDPKAANCLEGGKRSYHTIIPGFLTKAGAAIGPFGIMGGYMQPQAHVQLLMNSIDFRMDPQAALDAPRWQWTEGKSFLVEPHFPQDILEGLQRRGHDVQMAPDSGTFGRGQAIWRDPESGVLVGGTESRADSIMAGW